MRLRDFGILYLATSTLIACGATKRTSEEFDRGGSGPSTGGIDGIGGLRLPAAAGGGGSGNAACTSADLEVTDALVAGTVYAPNMTLPISGALVYLTRGAVEPIPDRVYCATCVKLDCHTRYAMTEADGTFQLPAVSGDGWKLVVQKGQFLRVSSLNVAPGANMVSATVTNLPAKWEPTQGMWIPKIAVYAPNASEAATTAHDAIENVLAKFGLGRVAGGVLVRGTEQFTLIDYLADKGTMMDDLNALSNYHLVFLPCAMTIRWPSLLGGSGMPAGGSGVPEMRTKNIRDYVAGGGRLYATDHSNEYISEPFPSYQDFYGSPWPDLPFSYDAESTIVDQDLLAWLKALPPAFKDIGNEYPNLAGLPQIKTQDNFSATTAIHPVIVRNAAGEMVDVGHHAFVRGRCPMCNGDATPESQDTLPSSMAMTAQYGCGRLMYSNFETSSRAHEGLSPQELVLLYMILEIGVCQAEPLPDVPKVK